MADIFSSPTPIAVRMDRLMDYVPVVSTLTAIVNLTEKAVFKSLNKPVKEKGAYVHHIENKPTWESVGLLVPGLNICVAAYSHYQRAYSIEKLAKRLGKGEELSSEVKQRLESDINFLVDLTKAYPPALRLFTEEQIQNHFDLYASACISVVEKDRKNIEYLFRDDGFQSSGSKLREKLKPLYKLILIKTYAQESQVAYGFKYIHLTTPQATQFIYSVIEDMHPWSIKELCEFKPKDPTEKSQFLELIKTKKSEGGSLACSYIVKDLKEEEIIPVFREHIDEVLSDKQLMHRSRVLCKFAENNREFINHMTRDDPDYLKVAQAALTKFPNVNVDEKIRRSLAKEIVAEHPEKLLDYQSYPEIYKELENIREFKLEGKGVKDLVQLLDWADEAAEGQYKVRLSETVRPFLLKKCRHSLRKGKLSFFKQSPVSEPVEKIFKDALRNHISKIYKDESLEHIKSELSENKAYQKIIHDRITFVSSLPKLKLPYSETHLRALKKGEAKFTFKAKTEGYEKDFQFERKENRIRIEMLDDYEFPLSIEIGLDEEGAPAYLLNDGAYKSQIPDELLSIVEHLMAESMDRYYEQKEHSICVVMEDLQQRPETHLARFSKAIKALLFEEKDPKIQISFRDQQFKKMEGADAGGLSRQYLQCVFEGFIGGGCKNIHVDLDGVYPRFFAKKYFVESTEKLEQEEVDIYENIGLIFMYCYLSENKGEGIWDNSVTMGRHFSPTLFKLVLEFSPEELGKSFSELSNERKFELVELLFKDKNLEIPDEHKAIFNLLQNPTDTLNNKELTELCKSYFGTEGIYDSSDIPDELKPKEGEKVLEFEQYGQNFKVSLEALRKKENVSKYRETLMEGLNLYMAQLSPIHAIAKGMKDAYALRCGDPAKADRYWQSELKQTHELDMSDKVQGTLDREKIANSIVVKGDVSDLKQQALWLRNMIKDKEALPEKELKQFLVAITGSAGAPLGKKIMIREGTNIHIHTCAFQLDLPNRTLEGLNKSEEAFRATIKSVIKENQSYSAD